MTDEISDPDRNTDEGARFVEAGRHLDPVVEHLSDKFPDAGHEHVAEVVEAAFAELSAEAKIPDHLPALTQHHAQDRLLAEDAEVGEVAELGELSEGEPPAPR